MVPIEWNRVDYGPYLFVATNKIKEIKLSKKNNWLLIILKF
jgi:hypothetical protein